MKHLLLILLLCGSGLGNELPDSAATAAKSRVADPEFWTLTGVAVAAATADAITTQQGLDRGCYETNWLIGPYPSDAALWGSSLGFTAAASGGAYLFKRYMRKKPILRHLWRVPLAFKISSGTRGAIHNSRESCGFQNIPQKPEVFGNRSQGVGRRKVYP